MKKKPIKIVKMPLQQEVPAHLFRNALLDFASAEGRRKSRWYVESFWQQTLASWCCCGSQVQGKPAEGCPAGPLRWRCGVLKGHSKLFWCSKARRCFGDLTERCKHPPQQVGLQYGNIIHKKAIKMVNTGSFEHSFDVSEDVLSQPFKHQVHPVWSCRKMDST